MAQALVHYVHTQWVWFCQITVQWGRGRCFFISSEV